MSYVDGFVAAVPTAHREAFRQHSLKVADFFKEHGALRVVEGWGDEVPDGEITSFPMAVQCRPEETVVFSWIVWPSREAREAAYARMMSDPHLVADENLMPFDGKRLIHGSFETIVEV